MRERIKNFEESTRRAESPNCESLMNHSLNSNSNSRDNESRRFAENGQLASEISLDTNLNHLSGESNRRITQLMNGLFDNNNVLVQSAICEAINEYVLPQLQASLRSLIGPEKNAPFEKSERKSENAFTRNLRCSSRDELPHCSSYDKDCEDAHYTYQPRNFLKVIRNF